MPARRRTASARVTPAQPGLRLHAAGDRYSTLLKERERLLRSIGTKKQKLERALLESEQARAAVLDQLRPFLERFEAATAELRSLFEQLLAPGRLSATAARQVAQVREALAGSGYLGPPDDEEPHEDEYPDDDEGPLGDRDEPARSSRAGHGPRDPDPAYEPHGPREVPSAQQRAQGKDQASLRAVFRRLVAASHPDRAVNETDRELRTATMKQATQAYEAGDLARLLEIEKAWRRGQSLPAADSAEASCRELERLIGELRAQASTLQRQLRAAKLSGNLGPQDAPITEALEEAKADLEQLEALREFVTRYRDGKMSIQDFVRGPRSAYVDEAEALLAELLADQSGRSRRASPAKAGKRSRAKSKR